jgi:lipopolysaccharide/colanic/teichoic acid biosynthesis glycosyltransferase
VSEANLVVELPADQDVAPATAVPWPAWSGPAKRAIDVVGACAALLLGAPLYAALALLVLVTEGRPVFYRWDVVGLNGRPFRGYKFRTMVPDADALRAELLQRNEMDGPVFKIRHDPRVTRIGRFLRRHSLDELPQFWSVLKGDMSLVGPRPSSPAEYAQFTPEQRRRLSVTPGITCLWQVLGRNDISEFGEWVRLDLEYIDRWSLALDLKILLRTALVVFSGRGAW